MQAINSLTQAQIPDYLFNDDLTNAIELFSSNPQIFNETFSQKKNLFMMLVEKRAYKIALWLITNNKLDLTARDSDGHGAVYYACRSGNLPLAERVLFSCQNLEKEPLEFQSGTNSVLHQAAEDQSGCLQELLTYPIDLSVKDSHGKTALERAVDASMLQNVRQLLQAHADPNQGNPPPVVQAYLLNNLELCSLLLEFGANPNERFSKQPLLNLAQATDKHEFVSLFLRYGAIRDATFDEMLTFNSLLSQSTLVGKCTLSEQELQRYIRERRHLEIVDSISKNTLLHELVIDPSVNPNVFKSVKAQDWDVKNLPGNTPFIHCCKYGNMYAISQLLPLSSHRQQMHLGLLAALQMGRYSNVLGLLHMGVDAHLVDSEQNTLLHMISSREKIDELDFSTLLELKRLISLLIEKEINIEARNSQNKTALLKAIETGSLFITSQLVQANANRMDPSYLITACKARKVEITKLLLNKQISNKTPADPNQPRDEQNPLVISLKNITCVSSTEDYKLLETAEYQIFDTLIRTGAKPTIKIKLQSKKKITPVELASQLRLPEIVLMRLNGQKPPVSPLASLEDLPRSISPMPGGTSTSSSLTNSPHSPLSIDSRSHSPHLAIGTLAISENRI